MSSQIHQTKLNLVNPQVIDMIVEKNKPWRRRTKNKRCWTPVVGPGPTPLGKKTKQTPAWQVMKFNFLEGPGFQPDNFDQVSPSLDLASLKMDSARRFFWGGQPLNQNNVDLIGDYVVTDVKISFSKEKRHYGNLYIYMLCCICFWSPTIFAIPSRLSSSAAAEGPGASKGAAANSSRNSKCSGVEGASGAPWAVSKPRNRKMNNKWRMKVVATQNMWIPVCTLCSTTILDIHVSVYIYICGVDCICVVNCICEECISVS